MNSLWRGLSSRDKRDADALRAQHRPRTAGAVEHGVSSGPTAPVPRPQTPPTTTARPAPRTPRRSMSAPRIIAPPSFARDNEPTLPAAAAASTTTTTTEAATTVPTPAALPAATRPIVSARAPSPLPPFLPIPPDQLSPPLPDVPVAPADPARLLTWTRADDPGSGLGLGSGGQTVSPAQTAQAAHPYPLQEAAPWQLGPRIALPPLLGIENFGNTCYANSILQALYACEPFRRHMLDECQSTTDGSPQDASSVPSPTSSARSATRTQNPLENGLAMAPSLSAHADDQPGPAPETLYAALRDLFASMHRRQCQALVPGAAPDAAVTPVTASPPSAPATTFSPASSKEGGLFSKLTSLSSTTATPEKKSRVFPSSRGGYAAASSISAQSSQTAAAAAQSSGTTAPPASSAASTTEDDGPSVNGTAVVATEHIASFLNTLKKNNLEFDSTMHQDAHEMLNFTLNRIAEDLASHPGWTENDLTKTWVQRLFEGVLTNETKCLTCETTTSRDEKFLDLSIDIEQDTSLSSCLRAFSANEVLRSRNKFFCDVCNDLQEAEKGMRIRVLPQVLALHLKRFKYEEQLQRFVKLGYRVPFSSELRLFNTSDDAKYPDTIYRLFAVVVHIGATPHQGHYIALARVGDKECKTRSSSAEQWVLFDDDHAQPVEPEYLNRFFGDTPGAASAYVLFYQAVSADSEGAGLSKASPSAKSEKNNLVVPVPDELLYQYAQAEQDEVRRRLTLLPAPVVEKERHAFSLPWGKQHHATTPAASEHENPPLPINGSTSPGITGRPVSSGASNGVPALQLTPNGPSRNWFGTFKRDKRQNSFAPSLAPSTTSVNASQTHTSPIASDYPSAAPSTTASAHASNASLPGTPAASQAPMPSPTSPAPPSVWSDQGGTETPKRTAVRPSTAPRGASSRGPAPPVPEPRTRAESFAAPSNAAAMVHATESGGSTPFKSSTDGGRTPTPVGPRPASPVSPGTVEPYKLTKGPAPLPAIRSAMTNPFTTSRPTSAGNGKISRSGFPRTLSMPSTSLSDGDARRGSNNPFFVMSPANPFTSEPDPVPEKVSLSSPRDAGNPSVTQLHTWMASVPTSFIPPAVGPSGEPIPWGEVDARTPRSVTTKPDVATSTMTKSRSATAGHAHTPSSASVGLGWPSKEVPMTNVTSTGKPATPAGVALTVPITPTVKPGRVPSRPSSRGRPGSRDVSHPPPVAHPIVPTQTTLNRDTTRRRSGVSGLWGRMKEELRSNEPVGNALHPFISAEHSRPGPERTASLHVPRENNSPPPAAPPVPEPTPPLQNDHWRRLRSGVSHDYSALVEQHRDRYQSTAPTSGQQDDNPLHARLINSHTGARKPSLASRFGLGLNKK